MRPQEHFPRLPPCVRLLITARPLTHIVSLLEGAFAPLRVLPSPQVLRAPAADCVVALAARLQARPALAAALRAEALGEAPVLAKRLWEVRVGREGMGMSLQASGAGAE